MKKRMKFTSIIVSLMMILQICFANLCPAFVHAAGSQMISFVYSDFSNAAMNNLLYLQSDARFVQEKRDKATINKLKLTSSAKQLKGSAFFTQKVSVSSDKSFSTFFTFRMIPGTRADGIVFVLNDNTKNIGGTGSAIGYGGIQNSIGIEFDTFENHGYDSTNGIDGLDDPNDNHLGINVDGDPRSKVTLDLDNIEIDLADKEEKYAWIDYDGSKSNLEVRISNSKTRPDKAALEYKINISQYLNSNDVYAGFTAATGDCYEEHDIDSWYFDSKYNPIDTTKNTYINAPTQVTVNADKTSGVTGTTPVRVNVKNADGTNASNISVTLSTDHGTLDRYTVTTDENGNGNVNFNVNDTTSGTASIKAVAEGGAFGTCSIGYLGIPRITNGTKNGTGDTTMNFLPEDFISNYKGDAIKSINIESLPGHGSLKYNGQAVKVKDNILISNVNFLSFVPDMYFHGPTSFQWSAVSVNDQCSNIASETLNFSPVNHAPNAPGNFTVLLSGRDFKGGTVLPLSWGQATDPDNDPLNYIVEFYNGTSWIQIYKGSNLNCSYTLPATVSLDNAQFRVKAVDPGELYSPYTNSDLFKLDNSSPVITLNGASPITIEVNNDYTDPGATARDNFDGDITSGILVKNNVKANAVGTYTVEYTVTDTAGNTSTVTRTVYVKDTTSPIITLKGKADITIEVFSSYTDEGATATDNYDTDISSRIVTTGTVDTSVVRDYVLTYNVTDAYGNKAEPVTRTVHVVDTTKPVVKLIGDPFITVEVGSSFSDPGATASDNYDGDISGKIVADGKVITDKLGLCTITYWGEDSSGNLSDKVTRTVHVVDTTKPVIALNGQSEITIEVNSIYSDAGVSASDNYDGDLSHNAVAVSDLQADKVGKYTISYYVIDSSGNISDTVTRTINVVDTTKPVITLNGNSEITLEVHSAYTEPGASAFDNYDGDISGKVVIQGTVNMDTLGDNKITYNVTDTSGNPAVTVTRTVHVVDTTKPFITLKGESEITLEVHSAYTEPGASAFDNYDGDISGKIVIQGTVNMDILGDNEITYNVTDTSENEAVTVTRTVHVVDNTKPVITLKGNKLVEAEAHSTYVDAGASASDNYDGDLSKNIEVKNNVDTDKLGEYTVTYNVSDSSGNKADTVTRTVRVVDTTKPVITLIGDPVITIGVHNTYEDEGASASDNYDGNLSEKIEVKNTVDTDKLGEYTVTYNVSDSSGNKADTVTRTVRVIDAVKPVITLNGSSSVTIEVYSAYVDGGATAIDNYDGIITPHIVATGTVNTDKLGDYTISYDVTDSSGNKAATVTRTVKVVDTTKPFITLKGESEITLEVHSSYTDAGASAHDNYDGDISGKIITTGTVNIDKLGDYTISYDVTDSSGNKAVTVTRTIHVVDTTKPVITLKGETSVTIEINSSYKDAGASAMDNYDGDITGKIVVAGTVNTEKTGDYTISYNVMDSSGNKADTVTRIVHVTDTSKPAGTTNQANTTTLQTGSVFNFDTLIIIAAMFMIIGGVCFFKRKRIDF